jgi:hypothetical protein
VKQPPSTSRAKESCVKSAFVLIELVYESAQSKSDVYLCPLLRIVVYVNPAACKRPLHVDNNLLIMLVATRPTLVSRKHLW